MSPMFPEPPQKGPFVGATVNERLCVAGLMAQWDAAIKRGDREDAITLLMQTDLPQESAERTVNAVLGYSVRNTVDKHYAEIQRVLNEVDPALSSAFKSFRATHHPRETWLWLEGRTKGREISESLEKHMTDLIDWIR